MGYIGVHWLFRIILYPVSLIISVIQDEGIVMIKHKIKENVFVNKSTTNENVQDYDTIRILESKEMRNCSREHQTGFFNKTIIRKQCLWSF